MNFAAKGFVLLHMVMLSSLLFSQNADLPMDSQNPQEWEQLFEKAIESERQGNFDLALVYYKEILQAEPNNTAALVRIAKLLSWKNKFGEALSLLDRALELDDQFAEALFRKAQILSWQGNYDESIGFFIRFLLINPEDSDGHLALGRVYFWKGEYPLALENFAKALEYGEDERIILTEKAKVYLAMDNPDSAEIELNKVLELDPQFPEAIRLLEGVKLLYSYEFFPLSTMVNIYPDGSLGILFNPGIIYHLKKTWDFLLINETEIIENNPDNTTRLAVVYKGIDKLYLGLETAYTPFPYFNPYLEIKGSINGSIGNKLGAGVAIKGTFFGEPPMGSIHNDTLIEVNPEIISYFGGTNSIKLSGSWFSYTSGYNTLRANLAATVDYYKGNSISAGVSYGGSVDVMDNQRRTLEFATSVNQAISPLIDLSVFYNYIDTTLGQTHQIGLKTILHW
ncbi:MAG: tetratricopeptide repeat protein [Spirochaetaceae bacterium]|nr:tetratricopeptide repeat protein [Spirochaetaceae bacterium]